MKIAVLGGFGLMAEAALHDLARDHRVSQVKAVDVNVSRARDVLSRIAGRRKIQVVKGDFKSSAPKLRGVDVVLNCAWYEYNVEAMKLALALKAHYVDLGGLYHKTLQQLKLDADFKRIGRRAALGCGSTPGITNMMVAKMSERFERITTVGIYDACHDPSLNQDSFIPPFSIRTMIDEYVAPAPLWLDGRIKNVPAHGLPETLDFREPIGRVTAGAVIHSETATLPYYLKDKGVKNLFFKIVYPDSVKKQLHILAGMKIDPRDIPRLEAGWTRPRDFEILRVNVDDRLIWDCEMRNNGVLSAGAIGVGFTGAIAAGMLARNHALRLGAGAPESMLDSGVFFTELKNRKLFKFHETSKQEVLL